MKWSAAFLVGLVVVAQPTTSIAGAIDSTVAIEPVAHVYATPGGVPLQAYVFTPTMAPSPKDRWRAAIVLFHGGGWAIGEAAWVFPRAQHFAAQGMLAVAAQYRLSNEKDVTPLDAMADARAVIRWMRSHADSLGIDANRIAAYGISAGGHLAACAAIFEETGVRDRASPDALVLVSPAVSLAGDAYVQRLLGERGQAEDISPAEHVRKRLPPTLILQGDVDTVTPLAGAQRFCERLQAAGNRCELQVYKGFGHLFTPAGVPDDGWPKPDPRIQAEALAKAEGFLKSLGFLR
jgi:acetyl esterase/lipase